VNSVGCVHEQCRRTGRVERGYNFLRYNGALAYSAYNQSSFAIVNYLYGFYKIVIDKLLQTLYSIDFQLYDFDSRLRNICFHSYFACAKVAKLSLKPNAQSLMR
jgi:hypothetical protein